MKIENMIYEQLFSLSYSYYAFIFSLYFSLLVLSNKKERKRLSSKIV